ncbi:MAG TPA: DUF502 domain-containing protein [Arenimonas sp.]|nr:DUF502 domain-containing protein [Arenimonas sp.]
MHPHPTLRRLRGWFLTGLLTLLPIWLVWIVFVFLLELLSEISQPWVGLLSQQLASLWPEALGWMVKGWAQTLFGVLATVFVIVAVGALARRVVGQKLLAWFEALMARIPLAKTVYGSARKLLDLLQTHPGSTQRVVLIDFPHRNMKCVGFVTRVIREEGGGRELAAVYVPTTPNPTSGYLEIVPVDQLVLTDWTVDQAMAFIISGGAVSPESMPFTTAAERAAASGEVKPLA